MSADRLATEAQFALARLGPPEGPALSVQPSGCVQAIECGPLLLNQVVASPVAGGIHRLYLRLWSGDAPVSANELIGPAATGAIAVGSDRATWSSTVAGLDCRCTAWVHPDGGGWLVHVEVNNPGLTAVRCDAIHLQDVGLASRGQVRNNELFTSQYIDHAAFHHPEAGYVVMSRQNLPQPGETHPWLMQGCLPSAVGFVTDGFDFFGPAFRAGAAPAALGRAVIGQSVRQYETAYVAIQSAPVEIAPGKSARWTFFAHLDPHHPEASSPADLQRLAAVRAMQAGLLAALKSPPEPARPLVRSIFHDAALLTGDDLTDAEVAARFPGPRRHEERVDGQLWSFFHGDDARHVVLRAREQALTRPHGHILRAGPGLTPADGVLSSAFYAAGVFASQVTRGNTSLSKLLSGARDPLNLVRSNGLRVLVRAGSGPWRLLGVPSAFEMGLGGARWVYRDGARTIEVACAAQDDAPAMTWTIDIDGPELELLVSGEIAGGPAEYESSPRVAIDRARGRITVRPEAAGVVGRAEPGLAFHVVTAGATPAEPGNDVALFADGVSRGLPYFTLRAGPTRRLAFSIAGTLRDDGETAALLDRLRSAAGRPEWGTAVYDTVSNGTRLHLPEASEPAGLPDLLRWFCRDAVVHLSVPRGLEQANGGAWGVRDVCQGPVELLLAYGHDAAVADILRRVFSAQYARRGDWPQWFMFPPFESIQSTHSHGDVLIWPLKALCDYLEHAGDAAILGETLPYTDDQLFKPAEAGPLIEHVRRALRAVRESFVPGLSLPRYGEGDWDDSLQPADGRLRDRMVSAWTTELLWQTLRRLAVALSRGGHADDAAAVEQLAASIAADFKRHLLPDGVVAGFSIFEGDPPRATEYLLHPSDRRTGLRYRLIPMTRGIIAQLFSREQAEAHLELIERHLLYPDGARLMDRPTRYDGGRESTFRRSESAAFFGREIGLQYVHAHLRYAEALAAMGRADSLWHALRVVSPIAVTDVVPSARPRQRNCYFSSSDAAFPDRHAAGREYDRLRRGEIPVDGGWRVYSSGPGIYTGLVIRHLFGLRHHYDAVEFDPVLPAAFDGAEVELPLAGKLVKCLFRVRAGSCGSRSVRVNGVEPSGSTRVAHPYRTGGLRVPRSVFTSLLKPADNRVEIEL